MQQQIIAIVENFFACATTKLQKLQHYHAVFVELLEQGDTASVLTTIGEHLAANSPDGIFTGQIKDYKDGEGMLASEELFRRI